MKFQSTAAHCKRAQMILVVEEEKERILDEMEGFGSLTEADTSTLSALETQLSAQHQQPAENSADDADGKPTDIMYCIKWLVWSKSRLRYIRNR